MADDFSISIINVRDQCPVNEFSTEFFSGTSVYTQKIFIFVKDTKKPKNWREGRFSMIFNLADPQRVGIEGRWFPAI